MSWKDRAIKIETPMVEEQKPTSWKDRANRVEEQPTQLDALASGVAQGATLGFSEEIYGGLRAALDVATTDKEIDDILDLYKIRRDEARRSNEAAKKAFPKTYGAGEIGAGVATAFVPGLGALNAVKGARLATVAGKAALSGGIAGAGLSDADLTEGDVKGLAVDTAVGAGAGVATAGLMKGAGKLAQTKVGQKVGTKIKEGTKYVGKKIYGLLTDLTDDQIDTIIKNPQRVKNALNPEQLSAKAKEGVDRLQEFISQADNDAWSTLSRDKSVLKGAVPKKAVKNLLGDVRSTIKIKGPAQKQALNKLDDFLASVDNDFKGSALSETEIKEFIQALDLNIDWEKQSLKVSNDALKSVRSRLDQMLKSSNTNYKEAMSPVDDMVKNLQEVKRALAFRKEVGDGLVPTDTTISKFKTLPQERRLFSQESIKKLDDQVGGDLLENIKASQVAGATEGGVTQGSRNTLIGSIGGFAVTGEPVSGAALGYLKDRYGRKVGKEVLIAGTEFFNSKAISQMGKFAKPLAEAAQRGNKALAATHFLLQQQNPEYREKLKSLKEEDNEQ